MGADDLAAAIILYKEGKETAESVAGWIKERLHERKYGFVPDATEIEELQKISQATEYKELAQFASGRQKKVIRLGLRLREVEENKEKADQMKKTIREEFDNDAVHLAQAVQSRAITGIRHTLVDNGASSGRLHDVMTDVLGDSRDFVLLATKDMAGKEEGQAKVVHARIQDNAPPVFVIAGSGKAQEQAGSIAKELDDCLLGYEPMRNEGLNKLLYLFVDPVNIAS
jgi:hypothetical protein